MFHAVQREIPCPTSLSPKVFPLLPHTSPAVPLFFFFWHLFLRDRNPLLILQHSDFMLKSLFLF